jgi:hypothetical protein
MVCDIDALIKPIKGMIVSTFLMNKRVTPLVENEILEA